MKSLLKRITGDQGPAEGDATGFPQAVANSVHSLLQRITGPGTPPADEVPVRMAVSLFFFYGLVILGCCAHGKLEETRQLSAQSLIIRVRNFGAAVVCFCCMDTCPARRTIQPMVALYRAVACRALISYKH